MLIAVYKHAAWLHNASDFGIYSNQLHNTSDLMIMKNTHEYRSECPIARTLDLIGDHWTLLIVRDLLLLGRHEFKDMLDAEEGISTNILVDRLKKLERHGLVASTPYPQNKKRKLYYLTANGKDLIHVIVSIARWSLAYFGDGLKIPPELHRMLINAPDRFVKQSLQNLKVWEQSYGIDR